MGEGPRARRKLPGASAVHPGLRTCDSFPFFGEGINKEALVAPSHHTAYPQTRSHARPCTHARTLRCTHTLPLTLAPTHPHPLFPSGGRDPGPRGRQRWGRPRHSDRRGPRGPGAGDSAAPPSPGRSAEPPPGRAALAPALCYANSLSQLVPAACTMSAPSPRQPSPAREWGQGGGGRSAPSAGDPKPAQPGGVASRPISNHPPVLPSPMLAGPRPSGPAGHPLIHSSRPGCPPSRCQGLMKSKRLLGGSSAVRMKEKQPPPRPHS